MPGSGRIAGCGILPQAFGAVEGDVAQVSLEAGPLC